jgi:DNA-binding transcriptional MocR family regulator
MDHKVAFVPGPPFLADGSGRDALRLAFSRVDDDLIEEGVRRLASVVSSALATRGIA